MTRVVLVTPFPAMSDGLIMLLSVALVKVKRRMWMERIATTSPRLSPARAYVSERNGLIAFLHLPVWRYSFLLDWRRPMSIVSEGRQGKGASFYDNHR